MGQTSSDISSTSPVNLPLPFSTALPGEGNRDNFGLPRASRGEDGRFILRQEDFPDYVEYSSLLDLVRWKLGAEPHATYSEDFLNKELPVLELDKEKLSRGFEYFWYRSTFHTFIRPRNR